ncbi:MAG: hypothetical protein ABI743_05220 [bacterium]
MNPNTWAFRPFNEIVGTIDGSGFALRLLADTVYPYRITGLEPVQPPWWDSGIDPGLFPDYIRNWADLAGPLTSADPEIPNFPGTDHRGFNAVMANMIGFTQGDPAEVPNRVGWFRGDAAQPFECPISVDDFLYPFTAASALDVLEYYVDSFLDAETFIIIQLPTRDILDYFALVIEGENFADPMAGIPPFHFSQTPDNSRGEASLRAFVRGVLLPTGHSSGDGRLGLNDRVIGWYSKDEPEIIENNWWALPARLTRLRNYLRALEWEARLDLPESGFVGASIATKIRLLRPVVLNFSAQPYYHPAPFHPGPFPPAFASAIPDTYPITYPTGLTPVNGAADVYMLDNYPWKRTKAQIETEFTDPPASLSCLPYLGEPEYKDADPVRSLRQLRSLRRDVNGGNVLTVPGDPGYVPVVQWKQVHGIPDMIPSTMEPSPDYPPAGQPALPTSDDCGRYPKRDRRRPSASDSRFDFWGGFLDYSEGVGCWSQPGAPDLYLRDVVAPVQREIAYFQNLRWDNKNLDTNGDSGRISLRRFFYPPLPAGSRADGMPISMLYLHYLHPPLIPVQRTNMWLILVNRASTSSGGLLVFNTALTGEFRWERVDLLVPSGVFTPITAATPGFTFSMIPWSVQIYRRI